MTEFTYITLRQQPQLRDEAAQWFHSKWGVPTQAYLDCMNDYLDGRTEYGWYLCLAEGRIAGGLGVIENDFHPRRDLTPNICAVYTEADYRRNGIAGQLLNMAVEDLRSREISPVYLLTNHIGFYERYGWEYLTTIRDDTGDDRARVYIHH